MVEWQTMESYRDGDEGLFWIDDGFCEYAVFGVIECRGYDTSPRVWDDNDFGYGLAIDVVCWTPCAKPARRQQ